MTDTLTPAPRDPQPVAINMFSTPTDAGSVLDGEPLRRMTALHQRAEDIFAQTPSFETIQELQATKLQHQNRIADILLALYVKKKAHVPAVILLPDLEGRPEQGKQVVVARAHDVPRVVGRDRVAAQHLLGERTPVAHMNSGDG